MLLHYVLFFLGFIFLIKGADLLVDGAAAIAKHYKVSNLVIGLTIVAFGTSAPEFVVNIIASLEGNTQIAIGNIVGSNVANILLILGISTVIYPLTVQTNTVWREIPFSLLAALVLAILANDIWLNSEPFNILGRGDGLILLCFFLIFMVYTKGITKVGTEEEAEDLIKLSMWRSSVGIILGLVGLTLGGKWIVEGATTIAIAQGLSQSIIAITVIAIGTSLPELATSVAAARKKQSDIIVGNVIGSNIFNIFWILGVSSILSPLPLLQQNNVDLFVILIANLMLLTALWTGKKYVVQRWHGVMFLLVYTFFIGYQIIGEL